MSRRYDCSEPLERTRGIAEAVSALRRGELVVLPTDTVYGIGCDAFTPTAVTALLNAKGRDRDMPPPVLVGSVRAAVALVEDLGTYGQDLIEEFWPGALTIVCQANPNLLWDLGDTKGTVAVRMPLDQLALEVLKENGPMAVSSANLSGAAAARSAEDAEKQLGTAVSVYLDGGPSGAGEVSSIVDLTGPVPKLLRAGAIPVDKLRAACGILLLDKELEEDAGEDAEEPRTDSPISLRKAIKETKGISGEKQESSPQREPEPGGAVQAASLSLRKDDASQSDPQDNPESNA